MANTARPLQYVERSGEVVQPHLRVVRGPRLTKNDLVTIGDLAHGQYVAQPARPELEGSPGVLTPGEQRFLSHYQAVLLFLSQSGIDVSAAPEVMFKTVP